MGDVNTSKATLAAAAVEASAKIAGRDFNDNETKSDSKFLPGGANELACLSDNKHAISSMPAAGLSRAPQDASRSSGGGDPGLLGLVSTLDRSSPKSMTETNIIPSSGAAGAAAAVRVIVRMRPASAGEASSGLALECLPDGFTLRAVVPAEVARNQRSSARSVNSKGGVGGPVAYEQLMRFDRVYDPKSNQALLFADSGVMALIDRALDGYASAVFAYGQTGSGKTYTMTGSEYFSHPPVPQVSKEGSKISLANFAVPSNLDDQNLGVIPRALRYLFHALEQRRSHAQKYTVKASYVEIYNEKVRDLLNPTGISLAVRWSRERACFYVENAFVAECDSLTDCLHVMTVGLAYRTVAGHALNARSSRSHAIFFVYLDAEDTLGYSANTCDDTEELSDRHPSTSNTTLNATLSQTSGSSISRRSSTRSIGKSKNTVAPPMRRYGKIAFVDLAGSERLKRSRADDFGFSSGARWPFADVRRTTNMRVMQQNDTASRPKFGQSSVHGQTRSRSRSGSRERVPSALVSEANAINKSLLVLGHCISVLASQQRSRRQSSHVPYRDSCLTRLLMDALCGTGYALMIACVTPTRASLNESLQTLRYAGRARCIQSRPIVRRDPRDTMIAQLKSQIERLRNENNQLRVLTSSTALDVAAEATSGDGSPRTRERRMYILLQNKAMELDALQSENRKLTLAIQKSEVTYADLMRENERLRSTLQEQELQFKASRELVLERQAAVPKVAVKPRSLSQKPKKASPPAQPKANSPEKPASKNPLPSAFREEKQAERRNTGGQSTQFERKPGPQPNSFDARTVAAAENNQWGYVTAPPVQAAQEVKVQMYPQQRNYQVPEPLHAPGMIKSGGETTLLGLQRDVDELDKEIARLSAAKEAIVFPPSRS